MATVEMNLPRSRCDTSDVSFQTCVCCSVIKTSSMNRTRRWSLPAAGDVAGPVWRVGPFHRHWRHGDGGNLPSHRYAPNGWREVVLPSFFSSFVILFCSSFDSFERDGFLRVFFTCFKCTVMPSSAPWGELCEVWWKYPQVMSLESASVVESWSEKEVSLSDLCRPLLTPLSATQTISSCIVGIVGARKKRAELKKMIFEVLIHRYR